MVYLGDNGYMLGEHARFEKHCFYEPAVRVPFLLRWPGRLPADRRVDAMVELVDLVPTVLDLLGQPVPDGLHGRSLVGLMNGESNAKGREFVFSEYLENEEAMVRSERYKPSSGAAVASVATVTRQDCPAAPMNGCSTSRPTHRRT